jgi:uncharacterized membrane protein
MFGAPRQIEHVMTDPDPEIETKPEEEAATPSEDHNRTLLPRPDQLIEYERISPGFAQKLVEMAQAEGTHRRELQAMMANVQRDAFKSQQRAAFVGQIFALLILLSAISTGIWLAVIGKELAGSILILATLLSLVLVNYFGYRSSREPETEQVSQDEKARS